MKFSGQLQSATWEANDHGNIGPGWPVLGKTFVRQVPVAAFLIGPSGPSVRSSFQGDFGHQDPYGQGMGPMGGDDPYQDLDDREEEAAENEMEEKSEHLTHMTCGISSGPDGGSQVTCGVPMYRDKATGAPYIMPLYTEPTKAPAKAAASTGTTGSTMVFSSPQAEAEAARAQMVEAASSARIRSDALNLLRGFLDAAPPPVAQNNTPSGFFLKGPGAPSKVFYPIPSKTSPTGIEVVPDVGPLGEPTPEVPGLAPGANTPGVANGL